MCAKPKRKARSKIEAKDGAKDDLFGSIPSMPEFNAFPDDIISRLTAQPEKHPTGKEKSEGLAAESDPASGKVAVQEPAKAGKRGEALKSTEDSNSRKDPRPAVDRIASTESVGADSVVEPGKDAKAKAERTSPPPLSAKRSPDSRERLSVSPVGIDSVDICPDHIGDLPPIRTRNQRTLRSYLLASGDHVTTYQIVSRETGVPVGTVRDVFRKFEALGLMAKAKVVKPGGKQGMRVTVHAEMGNEQLISSVGKQGRPGFSMGVSGTPEQAMSRESLPASRIKQQSKSSVEKDSRKRLRALGDEDIALFYPHLAEAGFCRAMLRDVLSNLDKVGKPDRHVLQSLEYADWDMGNAAGGALSLDKVFAVLSRTGCYPRPEGYVPPEVRAELDKRRDREMIDATLSGGGD